jgi:hypothetical protein
MWRKIGNGKLTNYLQRRKRGDAVSRRKTL